MCNVKSNLSVWHYKLFLNLAPVFSKALDPFSTHSCPNHTRGRLSLNSHELSPLHRCPLLRSQTLPHAAQTSTKYTLINCLLISCKWSSTEHVPGVRPSLEHFFITTVFLLVPINNGRSRFNPIHLPSKTRCPYPPYIPHATPPSPCVSSIYLYYSAHCITRELLLTDKSSLEGR